MDYKPISTEKLLHYVVLSKPGYACVRVNLTIHLLECVASVYVFAVLPGNTKIPVFLGFSESCVYVILFYLTVFPGNIKIPVCLGLSGCLYGLQTNFN
jgi:hypothetical protein